MIVYRAPLDDIRFGLYELFEYERTVATLPGCEAASRDVVDAVLEGAARFCENELLPLNAPGDRAGCTFENGVVHTPPGFKEAYRAFAAGGWTGLSADPAFGGQGLPHVLQGVLDELVCATNLSFGTYPGLTAAAYRALARHGSEAQKARYLPRLVDGTWSGTMCLTEAQCGTDLGLIRSRAEPNGDGAWRVSGTKIFISAGEHDLTENIVHLVLARLPGAPAGTRGISLFLVPKFVVAANGTVGARNGVTCSGIEDKMGIKASATCVLNFENAAAELVGAPNKGMRTMFAMMNAARLAVGLQGLGLAETAYQSAAAYARERRQGRALSGPRLASEPADPILVHPDVRANLLRMRAVTEGARALALWVGTALDTAERHPDPARRAEADDLVALMTPIVKAFLTDHGFAATNLGLQVFGGHGYIRETGIEQLVRDARIAQIYEGTNGIQALDLVGRKMGQHTGRLLRRFFHPVAGFLADSSDDPALGEFVAPLAKAFARLQRATAWLAQASLRDPEQAGAAASAYLRLFALVALAYLWARTAKIAMAKCGGERDAFYRAKLATARFYMARVLPETGALFAEMMAGAGPIMAVDEAWF